MQGSSEAYEPAHRLQFASGPIPTLVVYWPKLHCLRKGRALIQVLRVIALSPPRPVSKKQKNVPIGMGEHENCSPKAQVKHCKIGPKRTRGSGQRSKRNIPKDNDGVGFLIPEAHIRSHHHET